MDIEKLTQNWAQKHRDKIQDADEAIKIIKPGYRIFIGSGAAVPQKLVQTLTKHADELYDTELLHILTLGVDPTVQKELYYNFRHSTFFVGDNVRKAVQECQADYTPIFLSEIPSLFKIGAIPVDIALIQVSPPDKHGFCSYGVSVDIVKSGTEAAHYVIAEINPNMPRTLGDSFIHMDEMDSMVFDDQPILELFPHPQDEASDKIGKYVASLIEDGSTMQMGVGVIPDAVLANLDDKKDLGIHTEMFSDSILPLMEKGVITNLKKTLHRKKIITSFVIGSRKLYDFVDNNPLIEFHPSQYTNDPFIIAQNNQMVAINSALEVDLTGQVCADSIGHRFYSGIGGQVDFIRGAARAKDGKPVIALPSTAKKGTLSRIVVQLSEGAGVVTTRGDVHYVVTEYGIAYLHGENIRQRALSLINIAHPKFRKELIEGAKAKGYLEKEETIVMDEKSVYPEDWEKEFTIKDGTKLFFRPVKNTDERLIKELFYSHSDETRYFRFFTIRKYLPRKLLRSLVQIDYHETMAFCAVNRQESREQILAVARYYMNRHTNMAEFAIVVHDDWQRKGVGKALLTYLIEYAKEKGIKGFTADVLADNVNMLKLIGSLGITTKTKFEAGVGHIEFHWEH